MARDPVCGMTVDGKKAAASTTYEEKTSCFCSAGCKVAFESAPARYATR